MHLDCITFGIHWEALSIHYNEKHELGTYTKYVQHPKLNIILIMHGLFMVNYWIN